MTGIPFLQLERLRKEPVTHLNTSADSGALPEGFADVEETRAGGRRDGRDEKQNDQLWTDKYRPNGFRDLLSDAVRIEGFEEFDIQRGSGFSVVG